MILRTVLTDGLRGYMPDDGTTPIVSHDSIQEFLRSSKAKHIGSGNVAHVCKVEIGGVRYALKSIQTWESHLSTALREARIPLALGNMWPGVPAVHDVVVSVRDLPNGKRIWKVHVLQDLMKRSLGDALIKHPSCYSFWAFQLFDTLSRMHLAGVSPGDNHGENLMVGYDQNAYIIDLGLLATKDSQSFKTSRAMDVFSLAKTLTKLGQSIHLDRKGLIVLDFLVDVINRSGGNLVSVHNNPTHVPPVSKVAKAIKNMLTI